MTKQLGCGIICAAFVAAAWVTTGGQRPLTGSSADARPFTDIVQGGTVSIELDVATLDEFGLSFISGGLEEEEVGLGHAVTFPVDPSSTLRFVRDKGARTGVMRGQATTRGALLLLGSGGRVVIGNFVIKVDEQGRWTVTSTLGTPENHQVVFELSTVGVDPYAGDNEFQIVGELSITESWANALGVPEVSGIVVGRITIDVGLVPRSGRFAVEEAPAPEVAPDEQGATAAAIGPDILVGDLHGQSGNTLLRLGKVGDITAFSVGTTSCNIGDERAIWVSTTNQHPVIAMGIYRLKNGRFEHIGQSWVKHGFYALSGTLCGPCNDPTTGTELGVGCSDPYSAYLNAVQGNMSMRSDINAHTGYFVYPWTAPSPPPTIGKRIQVHDVDLEPDLNLDAQYFVQGHYVSPDEALAGNGNNSSSYRPATVTEATSGVYNVVLAGQTQRGQAAVRAWQDYDSSVDEVDFQVPGEGLFIVAVKATDLENGFWRYEYAIENLNSDRSGGSFTVPLARGVTVQNVGFHDVDYHSGEPYALTDWEWSVMEGEIVWYTESYDQNPNANALRFSTIYNFRFEANVEPGSAVVTIGLFKPGQPLDVQGRTLGPSLDMIDCQLNGIEDRCDIACGPECPEPCGGSLDCNTNMVPDECEPDCNENGVADECDIRDCLPGDLSCADCIGNGVPDGCEADCDRDGIPDECDTYDDCDHDGVPDCFDLCMCTTPPGSCACPAFGWCCFDFVCLPDYPRITCIEQGGTPDCMESPCRDGCLVPDPGKLGDLVDTGAFQRCFSGRDDQPGYEMPRGICLERFDFDGDDDIDLADHEALRALMDGP